MDRSLARVAEAFAAHGFEVDQVLTRELDDRVVRERLADYARTLTSDDTFVLYSHCHGGPFGTFFAFWQRFADMILALPARNVVVLAMSCQAGNLTDKLQKRKAEWEGRAAAGRSLVVLTPVDASQNAGPSPEPGIGNPFMYAVISAMQGDADKDRNGRVEMQELVDHMLAVTRAKSRDQSYRPQFAGVFPPVTTFVAMKPEAAAATQEPAAPGLAPTELPAPADDVAARVVSSLGISDPFVDDSPTGNLVAAKGSVEAAIRAAAGAFATDEPIRGRALRLVLAWDLADRVRNSGGQLDLASWLALDELDRLYAAQARAALLARGFAASEARDAALQKLAEARTVAQQFCRDWNEIVLPGREEKAKDHDAEKAALVAAGDAAVPYLLGILCVPSVASFGVGLTDRDAGSDPTAREQVRALYALGFLRARVAAPMFVFHAEGPSFTESSAAQWQLHELAGVDIGDQAGSARAAAVARWWGEHREEYGVVLDHLVRATLRWSRVAIRDNEGPRDDFWQFGPVTLARLVGPELRCATDGDADARRARVDALLEAWLASRKPASR